MYLYRRNATYYFRMRIPQNLRISLKELRCSLNTTNKQIAKKAALFVFTKLSILLENEKKGLPMDGLTVEENELFPEFNLPVQHLEI